MRQEPPMGRTGNLDSPTVSFCFDDGYLDNYTVAFPLFRKYDMVATSFVIAGRVGGCFESQKLMGWDHLQSVKEEGWEVGCHSLTHPMLTELNHSGVDNEVKVSSEILKAHGISAKVFAVPYGEYNASIRQVVSKYYKAMRTSVWGFNFPDKLDQYELKTMWAVSDTSLDDMKSWINELRKNRSWLIVLMHHVEERKTQEYTFSNVDLEMLLKYVKEKEIKVKTVSDALAGKLAD